ncbi:sensor histidine kinase [Nocardia colli]|uniref:histidine kinase n=1 Tax=Nocardia colli TaxID=2545717 RepID=A0A5N0DUE7_9NOCA|nr:ATP-binding protein [Nocardia colli]KAA8880306.1 sensor histidine kinase [Nocardia colli]
MNQDIAVVLSWILAAALVVVAAVALYAVQYARQQRARVEALSREQRAAEEAVEHFATTTLPSVAESIRRFDSQAPTVEVPPGLENSRTAQVLRWIAERYADDLSLLRSETRDQTNHEAQQAIKVAEDKVRGEVSTASRQATSAAVRSFGTSVVSLGADVSQVVSSALREHRNDEVYETLTRIDHTVQQMIRQAQSYVIVCGGLPGRRWPAQSLTDVVGGAVGRVRDYLRVRPTQLDRVVISRAVEPLVHTLATLLDNALRYSPPTSYVDVSFQEGHHGVTVIIDDAGVRMNAEQMEEARQVLAHERSVDIHQLGPSPKVGFPGIAALARRYGFTVYIDGPNVYGGMRAMVYIPEALLMTPQPGQHEVVPARAVEIPAEPAPVAVTTTASHRAVESEEPSESEPFAVHEITNGGLPKRRRRTVALAPVGPRTEPGLARPDVAAAWHTGSQSGRAAATEQSDNSDHTEGMTS